MAPTLCMFLARKKRREKRPFLTNFSELELIGLSSKFYVSSELELIRLFSKFYVSSELELIRLFSLDFA